MANSVWISLFSNVQFSGQQIGPAASNIAVPPFTFVGDLTTGYASASVGQLDLVTAGSSRLSISSAAATFGGGVPILGSNDIRAGAANFIYFNGRGAFSSPADSQINLTNNQASIGVGIDVGTDTILKVRTRAQTGYATLDCLGLKASGVAGASGTGTTVSQLTVVNGIVTSCTIA